MEIVKGDMATEQSKPEPKERRRLSRENSTESIKEKKLDSNTLGLEIYTTKEQGWPTNFNTEDLAKALQNNKYKWQYKDDSYSEDYIIRKLSRGEIILNKCFYLTDNDEYRKISGLIQDRSPAENSDPRLNKKKSHYSTTN